MTHSRFDMSSSSVERKHSPAPSRLAGAKRLGLVVLFLSHGLLLAANPSTAQTAENSAGDPRNRTFDTLLKHFITRNPDFILSEDLNLAQTGASAETPMLETDAEVIVESATQDDISLSGDDQDVSSTNAVTATLQEEQSLNQPVAESSTAETAATALVASALVTLPPLDPPAEQEDTGEPQTMLEMVQTIEPVAETAPATDLATDDTVDTFADEVPETGIAETIVVDGDEIADTISSPAQTESELVSSTFAELGGDPLSQSPPIPILRPDDRITGPSVAPESAVLSPSGLEVISGSEALEIYDQLNLTGTSRRSVRYSTTFSETETDTAPLSLSETQSYSAEELEAMSPEERWDAIMMNNSQ